MSSFEVETPILNSPYDYPGRHWELDEKGQPTQRVENFPGFPEGIMGPELMTTMREQAERMGTTIIDDEVVNVDFKHKPFPKMQNNLRSII